MLQKTFLEDMGLLIVKKKNRQYTLWKMFGLIV
jgi:hypothetical protein